MSRTVFEWSFLVTLALFFLLVGNPLFSYLETNYPNLGEWTATVTVFIWIGLALVTALFISFLYQQMSHR